MVCYLYLIKFADGSQSVAVGQEDHGNFSEITEVYCSEPQYIDDNDSIDDVIKLVKEKMKETPDPSKRVVN